MCFRYSGVPYEDVAPADYFGTAWGAGGKAAAPFAALPLLVVDEKPPLAQSGAIMRYVAKVTGLEPTDPLEAARCDALFEAAQELTSGPSNVNPIVNVFRGDVFAEKRKAFFELAPPKIATLEKVHGNGSPFFFGAAPTYADFGVYHVLSNVLLLEPTALDQHPGLQRFMAAVEALPTVRAYLDERPDAVEIGVAPMLRPKAAP